MRGGTVAGQDVSARSADSGLQLPLLDAVGHVIFLCVMSGNATLIGGGLCCSAV